MDSDIYVALINIIPPTITATAYAIVALVRLKRERWAQHGRTE